LNGREEDGMRKQFGLEGWRTMGGAALLILACALPGLGVAVVAEAPVPREYEQEVSDRPANWSSARAALGKQLFHDRRLSRDGTVSCATCHDPQRAFSDGRPTAVGIRGQVGHRNTPTLVNRALGLTQFWDGRAATLEEQALGPIANPAEMDLPIEEAVSRVAADASYRRAFRSAFGDEPTAERMAEAIAAYERTIYSVDAPFDRFLAGDPAAMSEAATRGLALFAGKARCAECHTGSNFSDELFHCIGVPGGDHGRGAVSGNAAEGAQFKTPTLREVARTAPYMHDGSLKTLIEVVEFYDRGGEPHANLDARMSRLSLTPDEKADLVAFLEALSGSIRESADLTPGGAR
jgi:cytochrome c peroxidase